MLGSDPELFLANADGYVSAIGLIGGTKDRPRPIKELGKGFYVQEDNVLLEFNTPPAGKQKKWVENHTKMLDYLNTYLADKGLSFKIDASAEMPKAQLMNPKAHVFGCEPDFNAWTLLPNPRPVCDNPFLRVAGGHVHVAFKGSNAEKIMYVRKLDLFLGLWSVIYDEDKQRKKLYGSAGSFRFKPYGIEYRVLSNFWLMNKDFTAAVWDLTEAAKRFKGDPITEIKDIIDSGNVEAANSLFRTYNRWYY